jgi:hypothetical protein
MHGGEDRVARVTMRRHSMRRWVVSVLRWRCDGPFVRSRQEVNRACGDWVIVCPRVRFTAVVHATGGRHTHNGAIDHSYRSILDTCVRRSLSLGLVLGWLADSIASSVWRSV